MAKRKGPTPKRKAPQVMVKCLNCNREQKYPQFGACPKCNNDYAVYTLG